MKPPIAPSAPITAVERMSATSPSAPSGETTSSSGCRIAAGFANANARAVEHAHGRRVQDGRAEAHVLLEAEPRARGRSRRR